MKTKRSGKGWFVLAVVALAAGVAHPAWADQAQVEADLAAAQRLQENYGIHTRLLNQAKEDLHTARRGEDTRSIRTNIRNLEALVQSDINGMRGNTQDLANHGAQAPYSIPDVSTSKRGHGHYRSAPDRAWYGKASHKVHKKASSPWHRAYYQPNHGYSHKHSVSC